MKPSSGSSGAKPALRKAAKSLRDGLDADLRLRAAQRVRTAGAELAAKLGAKVVAGYYPIGSELDVLPLLEELRSTGRDIVLPVTPQGEAPLSFRRWAPQDRLTAGRFGVKEPGAAAPAANPDVILVPLLAFDGAGHRLGYGGGYYDRTLHALRAAGHVVALGVAFDEQETAAWGADDHDQTLDWILTQSGARRFEE